MSTNWREFTADKWEWVEGRDLKSGDVIRVWWSNDRQAAPNQARIEEIAEYTGRLRIWPGGCRSITAFTCLRSGMTIPNEEMYQRRRVA